MNAQNRSHFSNTHGKIWVIEKKYSGFFRAFQVPFGKEILLLMIAFKNVLHGKNALQDDIKRLI